jgi:hypothetical protein
VALHVDRAPAAGAAVTLQGAPPTGPLLADPLRPLFYGLDNTGADTTIRAWNAHTGALQGTATLPGVRAAQARASLDGSRLLISDVTNRQFVPVSLPLTATPTLTAWTGMRFVEGAGDFAFARLNGVEVVVWSGGQLLSAQDGTVLAPYEYFPTSLGTLPASLAVAADGRYGCMVLRGAAGSTLLYFVQGHRANAWSAGMAEPLAVTGASRCALDAAGSHVYVTGEADLRRFRFQAREPDRLRAGSTGSLQLLANGEVYAGGAAGVHLDPQLLELGRRNPPAGRMETLTSGDETRLLERIVDGTQVTATLRERDY